MPGAMDTDEHTTMNGTGRQAAGNGEARATTIAITSGKGGVGKTNLATNLGIGLAEAGHRVCLIDADFGLANVCIVLGRQPSHTMDDVLRGDASLKDAIIGGPGGLDILPAASGLERLNDATPQARHELPTALDRLERDYDYLIVDTSAGISPAILAFIKSSDETAVVITPEPTSLTDAFTMLKALHRQNYCGGLSIIVNMLPAQQDGRRLFARFNAATTRHLGLRLNYIGHVVMDQAMTSAVLRQKPLLLLNPEAPASRCLRRIAGRIEETFRPSEGTGRFSASWGDAIGQLQIVPDSTREQTSPASPGSGPAVITPPREMREAAPEPPEDPLAEMARHAVERLEASDTPETVARQFLARVEAAFSQRFRRRASDLRNMLQATLQNEQLSEEQHRELIDGLETAFEQRFGHPHRDPRELLSSLVELRLLPEDTALSLARQLVRELAGAPDASAILLKEMLTAAHRAAAGDPKHVARLEEEIRETVGIASEPNAEARPNKADAVSAGLLRDLERQRHELERRMTELCLLLTNQAGMEQRLSEELGFGDPGNPDAGD